jgi:hypothetical protein
MLLIVTLVAALAAQPLAQESLPPEFRGNWVAAAGSCTARVRFVVGERRVTLVNGEDREAYGDIAIAYSFFGRDYEGLSVVAIPEFSSNNAPFTIIFNADEVKGRTVLDMHQEIKVDGPRNPRLESIQAASRKLAARFPLNRIALKKCPAD